VIERFSTTWNVFLTEFISDKLRWLLKIMFLVQETKKKRKGRWYFQSGDPSPGLIFYLPLVVGGGRGERSDQTYSNGNESVSRREAACDAQSHFCPTPESRPQWTHLFVLLSLLIVTDWCLAHPIHQRCPLRKTLNFEVKTSCPNGRPHQKIRGRKKNNVGKRRAKG